MLRETKKTISGENTKKKAWNSLKSMSTGQHNLLGGRFAQIKYKNTDLVQIASSTFGKDQKR